MKSTVFILLALILSCNFGYSQKTKIYRTWITLTDRTVVNGALTSASRDGLVVLDWENRDTVAQIEPVQIKVLRFRRKGATGRGAWIGAVSGAAAGILIGFIDGDDEAGWFAMTAEQKAVGAGIGLAIPGTIVGMIIGSLPRRMVIKGDRDTYLALLPEIQEYVVQQKGLPPE